MTKPIDPITWYLYELYRADMPSWDARDHDILPLTPRPPDARDLQVIIESTAAGHGDSFYDRCASSEAAHLTPWHPPLHP